MRRSFFLATVLGALAFAPALGGCELLFGETKMSQGQLYQCGDGRYDPFFDAVHREQIAATSWPDDAKTSRKPIVTALNLKPDASNGTILTATHELKSGAAALGPPVEQTTASEAQRARQMHAEAKRLEDMKEQGEALRKDASDDKANMGAQKADDKAVGKKDEVKRELGASVDALSKMINDARHASREAEELASRLTAAWTGRPEDEKPLKLDGAGDKKKDAPPPAASASATMTTTAKKPPSAPKPAAAKPAAAAGPATAAPASTPAPTAKPPDEVFNP